MGRKKKRNLSLEKEESWLKFVVYSKGKQLLIFKNKKKSESLKKL